jgi:hypothetical protein
VFWLKSKAFLANFKEDIEFRVGLRRQIKEMRSFGNDHLPVESCIPTEIKFEYFKQIPNF